MEKYNYAPNVINHSKYFPKYFYIVLFAGQVSWTNSFKIPRIYGKI